MKKKMVYVAIIVSVLVFAFGSIYMPSKSSDEAGRVVTGDVVEKVSNPIAFNDGFETVDYVIIVFYMLAIVAIGLLVSRKKKGEERSEEDYFLAGKSLPWWAIGSSLIAANISAEQFVGQSGSAFAMGLAIASYEWMAALTLIIVGKFFLPIFIEKKIYTIPQFVEIRYNTTLKTILAVFWLCLYVFVNLATVMYLGALAMNTISGLPLIYGLLILAFFAAAYSLYGGLSAVAWTDVIQVVVLILGGIITTVIALDNVSGGEGVVAGFGEIVKVAPDHFGMIFDRNNPNFKDLPGLGVLIGGMWVANLYYWGFNQYIIQRTFAAKSLKESQRGIAFAAIIKIIIPFIVVIPGIAAFVMVEKGMITNFPLLPDGGYKNDAAYPILLNMLPVGLKGIAFAALIAAIVSSLASMLNSTATIFTMDIYKPYINKKATSKQAVNMGRITAAVALLIALPIAFLMKNAGQVFQVIQEWTGIVSPGILAIFILGLFWKKTTTKGAIIGVLASIPIALILKLPTILVTIPKLEDVAWINALCLPFMNQMGLTLLLTMGISILVSFLQNKGKDDSKGIAVDGKLFKTDSVFNIIAYAVMIILVTLYVIFWNSDMVVKLFG